MYKLVKEAEKEDIIKLGVYTMSLLNSFYCYEDDSEISKNTQEKINDFREHIFSKE